MLLAIGALLQGSAATASLIAHWEPRPAAGLIAPSLVPDAPEAQLIGAKTPPVGYPRADFDGAGAHAIVPGAASLNPRRLTAAAWVCTARLGPAGQRPVLLKSAPSHAPPWYQYGLFVMPVDGQLWQLAAHVSVAGRAVSASAPVLVPGQWGMAALTWDGSRLRLYWNGVEVAAADGGPGPLDAYDTPLLFGAYGNLPKTSAYCFAGAIGAVRLYDAALSSNEVGALFQTDLARYPANDLSASDAAYARRLDEALRQGKDVLGAPFLTGDGPTYEALADLLRPLFLSTGDRNDEAGVHTLIFAASGAKPPYIVPLADGSRIAADVRNARRRIELFVGPDGQEPYGADLDRLEGPRLAGGYLPVLETAYTDTTSARISQTSLAGWVPGVDHLVALVRLEVDAPAVGRPRPCLRIRLPDRAAGALVTSPPSYWDATSGAYLLSYGPGEGPQVIYALWSPTGDLPPGAAVDGALYEAALDGWRTYWDTELARGTVFDVPEPIVMDCQRNLLIQSLIMRWRYSLGAVVYHGDFYLPESSDVLSTLALYGRLDECRDGLQDLLELTAGAGAFTNWEEGEKLSHGAAYYLLTRDAAFIERNTARYLAICRRFAAQMDGDPHGLLEKQVQCADISAIGYCTPHLTVCWRGLRDMATVWGLLGRPKESSLAATLASRLERALRDALPRSVVWMNDGTLYVPRMLLAGEQPRGRVTETREGSYWNLIMPYAFASGFWEPDSAEFAAIMRFMREHGSLLLGMLRFNYYPVPIGSYLPGGLPGYKTEGLDNVYLPGYQRMVSDSGDAEALLLSFYARLAHGQTRGTFVSGEGETVGAVPGERYRSCYGTPNSANNVAVLLPLRLMLIRETFSRESGLPEGLFLADATPRGWLAPGKRIAVSNAPTYFGPVGYTLHALPDGRTVTGRLEVPSRDPMAALRLSLRLPGAPRLVAVRVNGQPWPRFDASAATVDLTGLAGEVRIRARFDGGPSRSSRP